MTATATGLSASSESPRSAPGFQWELKKIPVQDLYVEVLQLRPRTLQVFVRKSPSRPTPTCLRLGRRRSPSPIAATLLPTAIGGGLREALAYAVLPIRNILVEQTGHTPWVAGRPFFIVMAWALLISLLDRHFIQDASKEPLQTRSSKYYPTI